MKSLVFLTLNPHLSFLTSPGIRVVLGPVVILVLGLRVLGLLFVYKDHNGSHKQPGTVCVHLGLFLHNNLMR